LEQKWDKQLFSIAEFALKIFTLEIRLGMTMLLFVKSVIGNLQKKEYFSMEKLIKTL